MSMIENKRGLNLCIKLRLNLSNANMLSSLIYIAEELLLTLDMNIDKAEDLAVYWFDNRGIIKIGGIIEGINK